MAQTIYDFEINKNAVIINYSHLSPYAPLSVDERPVRCVVRFCDFFISSSVYEKGFRVFKYGTNISKLFLSLKEARQFVIDSHNKNNDLFKIS